MRRPWPGFRTRLRTRVTLAGAGAVALLVVLIAPTIISDAAAAARLEVDARLTAVAGAAAPALAALSADPASGDLLRRVGDDIGVVAVPPVGPPQRGGPLPATLPAAETAGLATVVDGEASWRVLTVTVDARLRRADLSAAALQFATPLDEAQRTTTEATRGVLIGSAVMVALAAALSWMVGGAAARPLRLLRDATAHLPDGGRVPTDQRIEEADAIAEAVNTLLDRVDEQRTRTADALEAARSFTANAAHELRTPLTSISANLDVLALYPALPVEERVTVAAELRADLDRLLSLLDALRELARGDLQPEHVREHVDLADIAEEVVASARRRHGDAEIALAAPPQLLLDGWPDGLRLMLANLVENALVHGAPPVRLTLGTTDPDPRHGRPAIRIDVDDSGSGIPSAERRRVFDRFVRGRAARPGTGLGLALVAQQVRLHAGTVAVQDAPTGGARVVVTLPRSPG